jgi:hypothetical protein
MYQLNEMRDAFYHISLKKKERNAEQNSGVFSNMGLFIRSFSLSFVAILEYFLKILNLQSVISRKNFMCCLLFLIHCVRIQLEIQ